MRAADCINVRVGDETWLVWCDTHALERYAERLADPLLSDVEIIEKTAIAAVDAARGGHRHEGTVCFNGVKRVWDRERKVHVYTVMADSGGRKRVRVGRR